MIRSGNRWTEFALAAIVLLSLTAPRALGGGPLIPLQETEPESLRFELDVDDPSYFSWSVPPYSTQPHNVYEKQLVNGEHLYFRFNYGPIPPAYSDGSTHYYTIRLYKNDEIFLEHSGGLNGWDSVSIYLVGGDSIYDGAGVSHQDGCKFGSTGLVCREMWTEPIPFKSQVPVRVEFDAKAADYPQGVKMLVARYGADPFPHPELQLSTDGKRPRMRFSGRVIDPATGAPPTKTTTVYFRLRDPRDSAKYVSDAGQATDGDNFDQETSLSALGGGSVPPFDSCLGPCHPLRVEVSPPDGYFELTLEGTGHASGDNYYIEGSVTEDMKCAETNSCAKTPTITAWKRISIESAQMYRKSWPISRDVIATDLARLSVVYVKATCDEVENQTLLFMHAPPAWSGTRQFYDDEREVVGTTPAGEECRLVLNSPLTRVYLSRDFEPSGEIGSNDPRNYGDFVAYTAKGTFPAISLSAISKVMTESFVEIDPNVASVTIPRLTYFEDDDHLAQFGRKWFRGLQTPNRFLVASAIWRYKDAPTAGANHPSFLRGVFLFNGAISDPTLAAYFPLTPAQKAGWATEVAAHELGHGFGSPHCWKPRFDKTGEWCTMATNYFTVFPNENKLERLQPQFLNGDVAFHAVSSDGKLDSEYLTIRQGPDPAPDTVN